MATSIDLAIDTSALVAIMLGEPEAEPLLTALASVPRVGICAPNRTELLIVIQSRLGDAAVESAKVFLSAQRIRTIELDESLADIATEGFRRFGKGRHPAGLNFGDCFSYALAIREHVPLLFKGNDFSKTDIRAAVYPVP